MLIFTDDFFPRLLSVAVSACLVVEGIVHLQFTVRAPPDTLWQSLLDQLSSYWLSLPFLPLISDVIYL